MTDLEYSTLKRVIQKHTGIDINAYKEEQMRRRLDSFIQNKAGGNVAAFSRALETDAALVSDLMNMLTINVTEFFRDPLVFEHLRQVTLPELIKQGRSLKIWSAGCSRGCEVYTLALLLDSLDKKNTHSILATDVDERALDVARAAGPYSPSEVRSIPAGFKEHFCSEDGRHYFAGKVRQRIQFRCQNLLSDPYDTGFDLIVCRNVMIYFTLEARRTVTRKFTASLSPGGLLLLGSTEALMPGDDAGLQSVGTSLYRRSGTSASVPAAGLEYLSKGA